MKDIPKSVCNRTQARKVIEKYPIFITDDDRD